MRENCAEQQLPVIYNLKVNESHNCQREIERKYFWKSSIVVTAKKKLKHIHTCSPTEQNETLFGDCFLLATRIMSIKHFSFTPNIKNYTSLWQKYFSVTEQSQLLVTILHTRSLRCLVKYLKKFCFIRISVDLYSSF